MQNGLILTTTIMSSPKCGCMTSTPKMIVRISVPEVVLDSALTKTIFSPPTYAHGNGDEQSTNTVELVVYEVHMKGETLLQPLSPYSKGITDTKTFKTTLSTPQNMMHKCECEGFHALKNLPLHLSSMPELPSTACGSYGHALSTALWHHYNHSLTHPFFRSNTSDTLKCDIAH